jgi:predicted dehydrogenase
MLKIVVVGYGHLGRWHLEKALSMKGVEVLGVVDPFEGTEKLLADRGHKIKVYSDIGDIIDDIDAAIVVTPTSYHYDLVKKLIINDKHVFCEKPMTSTYEQALDIQSELKNHKVIFQVGHSERFHGIWARVIEEKMYFSNDCLVQIERQAAFKGRATDVDVVQDLMIHDLDLANFLLSEKPMSVSAIGHKIRTNHWDHVVATLKYKSGITVQITSGRNYVEEVRCLKVMGNHGAMKVDLLNLKLDVAPSVSSGEEHVFSESYEKRDHLLEEQKMFFNSILKNEKIAVDIDAGVDAVLLVSKVLESLEKKTEVNI